MLAATHPARRQARRGSAAGARGSGSGGGSSSDGSTRGVCSSAARAGYCCASCASGTPGKAAGIHSDPVSSGDARNSPRRSGRGSAGRSESRASKTAEHLPQRTLPSRAASCSWVMRNATRQSGQTVIMAALPCVCPKGRSSLPRASALRSRTTACSSLRFRVAADRECRTTRCARPGAHIVRATARAV